MPVEGEVFLIALALGDAVGLLPVAVGVFGNQKAEAAGGHVAVDAEVPVALPVGRYPFVTGADRVMGAGLGRSLQEGEPADVLHFLVFAQVDVFREAEGEEREAQRAVRCLEPLDAFVRNRAEGEVVGQREADGCVGVFGSPNRNGEQQGCAKCQDKVSHGAAGLCIRHTSLNISGYSF